MTLDEIRAAVRACRPEERRRLFDELRGEFVLHPLEGKWGIKAETILEAIARASDLTQRGMRGVIAEAVFVQQFLPPALGTTGWKEIAEPTAADIPFDSVIERKGKRVRIQVKNQRIEAGAPKERQGCWVVEVQKTRTGKKNDEDTRPYRFTDFDLIAVCLWPSTGDWKRFTFALARDLKPRSGDSSLIEIMQCIPKNGASGAWSMDLVAKLGEFGGGTAKRAAKRF